MGVNFRRSILAVLVLLVGIAVLSLSGGALYQPDTWLKAGFPVLLLSAWWLAGRVSAGQ
jgi:hypothetical protein